ncbi:hypothetical protein [Pseudomonas sp. 31 R 17]|nr:hypothetical protein [Pseudomonas sp. 31 R 17]
MVGPHHRIARHRKPVRQRMTPAKTQAAIHFHRTGAVQARPLERQDTVQRAIGQGQQFLAGDHRHRATVRNGFIRRSRRIALRVRRHGRHIIHRLVAHQRRTLRLIAHHRHRVRNQRIARLQRRHRHRFDRRRRTPQQHRLGRLHMGFQPRPRHLPGQQLQQRPRPPGLDRAQHLSPQPKLHPQPPRSPYQQQVYQDFASDLAQQLIHLGRRQQTYPADHRRQIDKQQRLITEHQKALGECVLAQFQQFIEFGLGKVLQQLFAVGLKVRQQVVQLGDVVPQVVKRLANPACKGRTLFRAALEGRGFGKIGPLRLEMLAPLLAQIRFQPDDHRLVGRIQRLDVILGNIGVESDSVSLVASTFRHFKHAAGADGAVQRRAKGRAVRRNGLQRDRRVADGDEARALEQMHQGQPTLGLALSDGATGRVGRDRRNQCDLVPDLEHLLDFQCRATEKAVGPGIERVQAIAQIPQHAFNIRRFGVHGCQDEAGQRRNQNTAPITGALTKRTICNPSH